MLHVQHCAGLQWAKQAPEMGIRACIQAIEALREIFVQRAAAGPQAAIL